MRHASWIAASPGGSVMFTLMGLNAVGDGLGDDSNSRMRDIYRRDIEGRKIE